MNGFFGNVIAGIVASILTYVFLWIREWHWNKRDFRRLSGSYGKFSVTGEHKGKGVVEIKHLKRNILLTCCEEDDWEGRITMDKNLPEHGRGVYQYNGKTDCGVHEVQVNRSDQSIYVLVMNTSHDKHYTVSLVWKRINENKIQQTAAADS